MIINVILLTSFILNNYICGKINTFEKKKNFLTKNNFINFIDNYQDIDNFKLYQSKLFNNNNSPCSEDQHHFEELKYIEFYPNNKICFGLLKPDAIKKNLMIPVLNKILNNGIKILDIEMRVMDDKLFDEFYYRLKEKDYYQDLKKFMISGKVLGFIVYGENICQKLKNIVGDKNPLLADKKSIRGYYGTNIIENIIHISDIQDLAFEINLWYFKYPKNNLEINDIFESHYF